MSENVRRPVEASSLSIPMTACTRRRLTLVRQSALAIVFAALLALAPAWPADAAPSAYATPEAALQAFRAAVNGEDGKGLLDLFGKQYEADLIGGDPAEARQNLAALRRMAAQSMTLEPDGEDRMTIVMGRRGWPMPVPLVKGPSGWTFDVKEGLQEITDRRVGRNELSAIEFCKAYIDAQRRYASVDHDNDGVLEFAQRLRSSEGQQDGLYWKAGADGVVSPLGPARRFGGAVPAASQGGRAVPRLLLPHSDGAGRRCPWRQVQLRDQRQYDRRFRYDRVAGRLSPFRHHDVPVRP